MFFKCSFPNEIHRKQWSSEGTKMARMWILGQNKNPSDFPPIGRINNLCLWRMNQTLLPKGKSLIRSFPRKKKPTQICVWSLKIYDRSGVSYVPWLWRRPNGLSDLQLRKWALTSQNETPLQAPALRLLWALCPRFHALQTLREHSRQNGGLRPKMWAVGWDR